MATIFNQATLSFGGVQTNSNVTEAEVLEVLSATKTAVSLDYGTGDGIAYAISIVNSGTTPFTDVTVTDDLGAFTSGTLTLTPLDYIDGSVRYYQNGTLAAAPTVTAGPPLVFSGITVPAGGNVLLIYEAKVNAFADVSAGSVITNTAVVNNGTCESVLSAEVPVREAAELSLTKSVCPGEITCGGEVTYTFIVRNTGNTEAVATDDVIITDTFNPILNPITVTYNGTAWTEGTNYTYDTATGAFATLAGQITVPAATYARDPVSGSVTVTPGTAVLTVTGTI